METANMKGSMDRTTNIIIQLERSITMEMIEEPFTLCDVRRGTQLEKPSPFSLLLLLNSAKNARVLSASFPRLFVHA
jgi:hypothetical protein